MSARSRIALAASIGIGGYWLSGFVRHLVAYVNTNPARLGFEMMGIEVGLAALAIAVAVALPGPVTRRLGLGPSRLPTSAVIALAIGTVGLSHALDAALSFTRTLEGSVVVGISRGFSGAAAHENEFVIAFLGSAVAPAIGEELLCRGLLQRGLALSMPPLAAIALASLAFGWLHMELVHGALAACMGLYLGFAAYWGNSTRPAIAGHFLNNFVALLGSSGLAAVTTRPIPGLIIGLSLALSGIVWAVYSRPPGDSRLATPALQPDRSPADA
jgi:membrane protease YdiL (CAAX protease family)